MKTFLKHLRKYTITYIIVIIVLFIQAMCDLSLPDYTSKIVDVGIRQSGIEDNIFKEIKNTDYEKLMLFVEKNNIDIIKESYEQENDKYILKDIDKNKKEQLKNALLNAEISVTMIESDSEAIKEGLKKLNIENKEKLYSTLKILDENQKAKMLEGMNNEINKIDPSFRIQFGINYVKNIYQNTDINLSTLQNNYIKASGIKMLTLALLSAIITIIVSFLSSRLAAKLGKSLREAVVKKVMSFSNQEFKEISTASLITRSTNDINRVQMIVTMILRIAIYAPIVGIGALLKVVKNPMSYIILIAVLMILILVGTLFVVAMPKFKVVQNLVDKVNLIFREILNGLPVIRSFSNEEHEEERFDDANKELKKVNLFVDRVMTLMMPLMTFIMNFICVLIVWIGSKNIDTGLIQVGTLMAFIQYTMQIIMAFLMISMMSIMIPRAWISIKKIAEIFDKKPVIGEPTIIDEIKKYKGTVEFKDVYFRYHDADEDILENISFKATPGTTTAIIGGTGCGKSTLINLIPRFFDVTGGKILIDGVDVRNLPLEELRKIIGFVPQKGLLFTGTIESNIAFGDEKINKKRVEEAAKIAQAEEFILEKSDKYQEPISQGGTNVSGGQKQRLSIARAIYKKPLIYIFDDSFSALDFKTDKNLRNELKKVTKESTVFIVAQRISTVLNADQIIVLDEGKIVGLGKHEELMKNCEIYKEIALSQVTEEELKNGK